MIEVNAELQTCRVTEGLTEDAVSARLHQGKPHAPLGGTNVAEPDLVRRKPCTQHCMGA